MQYGTPHKYSAAYLLFHKFWLCQVPRNEMMDVNDFEYFGVMLSGNKEWDERLATAMEVTSISVAEMAQLMADGVPVTLNDPADAVPIYKLIIQHLKDWRDALIEQTFWERTIPLKGLTEFNQLASAIMPIARCHGLVDEYVEPVRNSSRSVRLYSQPKLHRRDARHSDDIFAEIGEFATARGQNLHWKPTNPKAKGSLTGTELYGK